MQSAWYPIALAEGLERGTSVGTRLFGRELVVWRDAAGSSHVWEDRCPHRGMRLSFGFVRDNHIACLYHGWQYDASARCRYIPAHPDLAVPNSIRVATYASLERLGFVWAYGELDRADPEPLQFAERTVTPVRSLYVEATTAKVLDALASTIDRAVDNAASGTQCSRTASLVSLAISGDEILIAVQPLSEQETALHIVIAGPADVHRGASQKRISAWSEALRRKLETSTSQIRPGATS
ncbi:Rieske (2Fe-2S) protein [Bradyrhizobium sp. ARR65]|uniref:Rieske (2Fe-2S) protein n=1 Tax=Bradyrhizobium sp. ARR65 TaxID=1040989 RepID=UPI000465C544|nr:Rieske (2Fe-2S) protein [Bradyrhizobium sp. ARR65]